VSRIIAILVAIGISSALQFSLGAPSYISLTLGAVAYFAVRFARDVHQNLSWKLGCGRGKAGRPWTEPWWANRKIYALAYMQGKGLELSNMTLPRWTPEMRAALAKTWE
jgi:hypothetical protein